MADDRNKPFELAIDKFTFRFPKDLHYSEAGLWIRPEGGLVRMGWSDFAQQRSGDIAFANLVPAGTALNVGDELASIETVKVNISLAAPIKGTILEVNTALQVAPEWINREPYGRGWMAVLQPADLEGDLGRLLDARTYLELAANQAQTELRS